jgi:chromosome transmission fidelity protein 1
MGELGQILLNFSGVIPGGMIIFLPSYSFLNTAKATWQKSGTIEKLSRKKQVSLSHPLLLP